MWGRSDWFPVDFSISFWPFHFSFLSFWVSHYFRPVFQEPFLICPPNNSPVKVSVEGSRPVYGLNFSVPRWRQIWTICACHMSRHSLWLGKLGLGCRYTLQSWHSHLIQFLCGNDDETCQRRRMSYPWIFLMCWQSTLSWVSRCHQCLACHNFWLWWRQSITEFLAAKELVK